MTVFLMEFLISEDDIKQSSQLEFFLEFNSKVRPTAKTDKQKKETHLKVQMLFMMVENLLLMLSKVEYFY